MCHPFFTGKQKFVDTAGRIERFQKKFNEGYTVFQKKKYDFYLCLHHALFVLTSQG
jgi:hypothetical protein